MPRRRPPARRPRLRILDGIRVARTRVLRVMRAHSGAATTGEAVDDEFGTPDLSRAQTYMEDPLRMVTHLIMSTPEYQID